MSIPNRGRLAGQCGRDVVVGCWDKMILLPASRAVSVSSVCGAIWLWVISRFITLCLSLDSTELVPVLAQISAGVALWCTRTR